MIRENEEDGIWGSVLQPSQGLFWYRVPDSELLVARSAAPTTTGSPISASRIPTG